MSPWALDVIQPKDRPSVAEELLEEAPSVELEQEPISKESSWNLGGGVPPVSREVPTWRS